MGWLGLEGGGGGGVDKYVLKSVYAYLPAARCGGPDQPACQTGGSGKCACAGMINT